MTELKDVLVVSKDKAVSPTPLVVKAKGNVPSKAEFDKLVDIVNSVVTQLKDIEVIK